MPIVLGELIDIEYVNVEPSPNAERRTVLCPRCSDGDSASVDDLCTACQGVVVLAIPVVLDDNTSVTA